MFSAAPPPPPPSPPTTPPATPPPGFDPEVDWWMVPASLSRETSSDVDDFRQLPMMNSLTVCRKFEGEGGAWDGDEEDIVHGSHQGEEDKGEGQERPKKEEGRSREKVQEQD
jgi:hypothetical protein